MMNFVCSFSKSKLSLVTIILLAVDAVLLQQGHDSLVSKGRSFSSSGQRGGITKLGKSLLAPVGNRFSREGIARYIISLPLNAVPIVGTAIFLLWNGVKAGPGYHARYSMSYILIDVRC